MKGCRVLGQDEITKIMENLKPRDQLLVLTGLTYGLRISETLRLTFGDFAGEYLEIDRRLSLKNSDVVTFPIPETYRSLLNKVREIYQDEGVSITRETPVFLNYKHQGMSRVAAHYVLKDACEKAGVQGKVGTHSFRKCFVTKIYEMVGKDLIRARHFSRHKSISNLQYYIETTENTDLIHEFTWA